LVGEQNRNAYRTTLGLQLDFTSKKPVNYMVLPSASVHRFPATYC